jgi:hypothetical protein
MGSLLEGVAYRFTTLSAILLRLEFTGLGVGMHILGTDHTKIMVGRCI